MDSLWKWYKYYLTSRWQRVAISQLSEFLLVLPGVPHGSILGLLLCTMYINDLPSLATMSDVPLFVDDTNCFDCFSSYADCSLLQDDLHILI